MKLELEVSEETYNVLRYMAIEDSITIEQQAIHCLEAWDNFAIESYNYKDSLKCKKRPCNAYHHHLLEEINEIHNSGSTNTMG